MTGNPTGPAVTGKNALRAPAGEDRPYLSYFT